MKSERVLEPFSFRFFNHLWLESRDLEVAPTGVCRESEFPPTEELNASERVLGLLVFGNLLLVLWNKSRPGGRSYNSDQRSAMGGQQHGSQLSAIGGQASGFGNSSYRRTQ